MKKEFLKYAKRGWRVIPVEARGKKPLIKDWPNTATTDESVINRWLTQWPEANVGILMGEGSGVFALDIDVRNNGDITLEGLETKFGKLPNTLTSNTGGGGKHLIFKYPDNATVRSTKIPTGIDVQSNGKFIVAPASIHESGKSYEWVDFNTPIAKAPDWLVELINKPNDIVVPSNREKQGNRQILIGERNSTLTSSAGFMHHKGLSEESIRAALLAVNKTTCEPPLSEAEVNGIVTSIIKYDNSNTFTAPKEKRINLVKIGSLLSEPEEKISYVVDQILPFAGISLLGGKPKTGKTTLVRQLAMCVAQGVNFLDRSVTKGPVLYFALEEKKSEVIKHFRDMGAGVDDEIHIHVSGAMYETFDEMRNAIDEHKPKLVIIDPIFRFVNVKDGNDYNSMTRALDPLIQLARGSQSHIICIHHLSKGDRQGTDAILGSTAILGSVDTALILKRDNHGQRVIYSEQRYGSDLEESVLDFDTVTRMSKIGGSKEEADIKKVADSICDFMSQQTTALTEKDIDDNITAKKGHKVKALRNLVTEGKVNREGSGGKGDPYKYSCSLVYLISKEQEKDKTILTDMDNGGNNNE